MTLNINDLECKGKDLVIMADDNQVAAFTSWKEGSKLLFTVTGEQAETLAYSLIRLQTLLLGIRDTAVDDESQD